MHDTLLVIHIIAVAVWFGGLLTLSFAASMLSGADPAVRRWFITAQSNVGRVLFSASGVLILITGIWLVVDDEALKFSDAFISIGFLVVIVGTALAMAVAGPAGRASTAAIDAGDSTAEQVANGRIMVVNIVNSVLLLVAIVAMVGRW